MLIGNAAANDTAGATAWFTPTVSLGSLTITYQQRSGLPVYQTWFANKTASLSGAVTLDDAPMPSTVVTRDGAARDRVHHHCGRQGDYLFPSLPQISGYWCRWRPRTARDRAVADPEAVSLVGDGRRR